MNRNLIAAALISALMPAAALADHVAARAPAGNHRDHPAIEVQRQLCKQGYDYASKFYPHPAWLYLYPEAPDVLLARRAAERRDMATAAADEQQRIAGR